MSGRRRRRRKKRAGLTVFAVILCLIVCVGAAGAIFANRFLNKINRTDEEALVTVAPEDEDFETEPNEGLEELTPEDAELETVNGGEALIDDDLLNILLVGQDRRPGQGRQRSDSMIVISVNSATKKVSMISFLRDLYVQIPGYTDNRLNAAYVFGGFPLLKNTLLTNFGITVDGCFEVDFDGFRALIDQIGGVEITLTAAEASRIGHAVHEGVNVLNGERALAYARIRKIDSDFQRTDRQRKVLMAAFAKIKTKSPGEILSLLDGALPYLTTDMSNTQIYALAAKLIPMATSAQVNTCYVPPSGTYSNVYIRGMAVLYPNLSAIRQILKNEYLPF